MAQQLINIGQVPNDKSGDLIRTAFNKVNQNFTELYSAIGADVQIPIQTGNDGKFLKTNGTNLSWDAISTSSISNGLTNVSIPSENGSVIISINNGLADYTFNSAGDLRIPNLGSIRQNSAQTESVPIININGGNTSLIYSSENWFTGYKLTIIVEGQLDGDITGVNHTQISEATIAATYNSTAEPVISVYGIVYTSPTPLASFSVTRSGNTIQVLATNNQTVENVHVSLKATKFVSYYD